MSFTNIFAHEMDHVCGQVEFLKAVIESFYASGAPHAEKMKVFSEAPDFLKNHERWIEHPPVDSIDAIWHDGEYHQRGSVINLVEELESLHENMEDATYTQEDIYEVEKWVLENNLGSYRFDW